MASKPRGRRKFGLKAPIKAQLDAILLDYPGGQLLSEALQNAEDSGATDFVLTLDERRIRTTDDPMLSRPAFVLADNGKGFSDREWASIQTLHDSKKADSPHDIGRFGMGSRSYFHYSDVTLVLSNGVYCGIDPLEKVQSHTTDQGGWMYDLDDSSPVRAEVQELFKPFVREGCPGATFRLPLRRDEEEEDGFGPKPDAMKLLQAWADSLRDGRFLMFLASVESITVQRWEYGSKEPVVLARTSKDFLDGDRFQRLPAKLPAQVTDSFEDLHRHLSELRADAKEELSKPCTTIVRINVCGESVPPSTLHWRIVQQFAASCDAIVELVVKCKAVPTVGLALPVPKSSQEGDGNFDHPTGVTFCFLPIGNITTGLPVNLNATFQVTKDRRSLLMAKEENLQGQHAAWAEWNRLLLHEVLPELWLNALVDLTAVVDPKRPAAVVECLPDLNKVKSTNPEWLTTAENVYKLASTRDVLPHVHGDTASWVAPRKAKILEPPPTKAFEQLREQLLDFYVKYAPNCESPIVEPPRCVAVACRTYGARDYRTDIFLEKLLTGGVPPKDLSPCLFALAERIDVSEQKEKLSDAWKSLLQDVPWIPVGMSKYASAANTFSPDATELQEANFKAVTAATANIDSVESGREAVMRTLTSWGMKSELTWSDAICEAEATSEVSNAETLLEYLENNQKNVRGNAIQALQQLGDLPIFPAVMPHRLGQSAQQATNQLMRASELCSFTEYARVWAVCPTSPNRYRTLERLGLAWRPLSSEDVEMQIRELVRCCEEDGQSPEDAELHLRIATQTLLKMESNSDNVRALQNCAWLPSYLGTELHLLHPARVAVTCKHDLTPEFGPMTEEWRKFWPKWSGFAEFSGVSTRLTCDQLASALESMAASTKSQLSAQQADVAINLILELSDHVPKQPNSEWDTCRQRHQLFVVTKNFKLEPAKSVFVDDAQWTQSDQLNILHEGIPQLAGRKLGCESVRAQLAKTCTIEDDSFGQEEDLKDRIRGLLQEYDSDLDVFTEHWQNSDDAGATELCFFLDELSSKGDKLPYETCSALQGPALTMASNKELLDADIKRIQRLGQSQKRKKFDQTGQFGVGLVCLYSITDCPTILAHGALHVLDPLGVAVPAPGKKFLKTKLQDSFEDSLAPFSNELLERYPTIFRLPLNGKHQDAPFSNEQTPLMVRILLDKFAARIPELLLFAKSIQSVIFATRNARGNKITTLHRFHREDPGKERFMQSLPKTLSAVKEVAANPPHSAVERVTIKTDDIESSWLVSHALHASKGTLQMVDNKYKKGTAMLPHGAVALPLDISASSYEGQLFCYLPIPQTGTGFPLLVHGYFDLPASRKHVPCGVEAGKPFWNSELLSGAVAIALAGLLENLPKLIGENKANLELLYTLMELPDTPRNQSTKPHRAVLRDAVLKLLFTRKIFPITLSDLTTTGWVTGNKALCRAPPPPNGTLSNTTQDHLVEAGMPLVNMPKSLLDAFSKVDDAPIQSLTPEILGNFCRTEGFKKWMQNPCSRKDWPCVVPELVTFITTVESRGDRQATLDKLCGTHLLLMADKTLSTFSGAREDKAYLDGHYLCPPSLQQCFVHLQLCLPLSRAAAGDQVDLENLGICRFTATDLVRYRDIVHSDGLNEDQRWRREAFKLIRCHVEVKEEQKQRQRLASLLSLLSDWLLVKVADEPNFVSIEDYRASVFSLEGMDKDYETELTTALHSVGYQLLDLTDTDQLTVFSPTAKTGDTAFISALCEKSERLTDPKTILGILSYVTSRFHKKSLTEADSAMIRSLPLFTDAQGNFVPVNQTDPYIILTGPRKEQLMQLSVSKRVIFMSPSPNSRYDLQEGFVKSVTTHDYVETYVCDALECAAKDIDFKNPDTLKIFTTLVEEVSLWTSKRSAELQFTDITKIVKRLGSLRIVHNAEDRLCTARELVDSRNPFLKCFDVPHVTPNAVVWKEEDRLEFLLCIGMQRHIPTPILVQVAEAMHESSHEQVNEKREQSSSLLKEICDTLNRSNETRCAELLDRIADFNLIVTCPSGRETLQAQLTESPLPSPQFGCLRGLGLSRDVIDVASHTHSCIHTSEISADNFYGSVLKTLCTKFGCFSCVDDVPVTVLIDQLVAASQFLQEHKQPAPSAQVLLNRIFSQLDKRAASSNDSNELAESLKTLCCIPIWPENDASGSLGAEAVVVRMVCPLHCFVRLPDEASQIDEFPFTEVSKFTHKFESLARLLGIRKEPALEDWVTCTALLKKRIGDKAASPSDIEAFKLASREILKRCTLETLFDEVKHDQLQVFFPDTDHLVAPAQHLVWPDRAQFKHRCTWARYVYKDLLPSEDWRSFCRVTGVAILSDLVHETLECPTFVEPNDEELCLEELLRSQEFCDSLCALMRMASPTSNDVPFQQRLAILQIRWAKTITTTLQTVEEGEEEGEEVVGEKEPLASEESLTKQSVFLDDDGTLILSSEAFEEDVDAFLSDLGGRGLVELINEFGKVDMTHVVVDMLKCWDKEGGPQLFQAILDHNDVPIVNHYVDFRPGQPVGAEYDDAIAWDPYATFQTGTTVAVLLCAHDRTFKYAQVVGAGQTSRGPSPTDGRSTRQYRVDEGGSEPVLRKTFELYKITRAAHSDPRENLLHLCAVEGQGEHDMREDSEVTDRQEFSELISFLREITAYGKVEYRQVMKELYLKWHPDKNKSDNASAIFRLLRRHAESHNSNGDWGWLEALTLDTVDDAIAASAARTKADETQADSNLFRDFDRETKQNYKRQEQRSKAQSAWEGAKITSLVEARLYSAGADRDARVADLLLQHDEWTSSVWHSQQSLEFVLKAVALCTCGITQTDLKGKGAHNLENLADLLTHGCPADREELMMLSRAYIGARYPGGYGHYGKEEARTARAVVVKVMAWANEILDQNAKATE